MSSKRILQFTLVASLVAVCLAVPSVSWAEPTDPVLTPLVTQRDTLNPSGSHNSAVSWGAVFGGAVVALSLQMLFTILGAGIGAAAIDPYDRRDPLKGVPTGAMVWWLVTGLISLFVGGWVSGKLSGATTLTDASLTVGGMHGLLMWSLATVLTFLLLLTSAGALVGGLMRILYEGITLVGKGAAATVSAAASGAATAASATASAAGSLVQEGIKQVAPNFDWEKVKREVRNLLRETGKPELQPENIEKNVEKKADQVKQGVQNFIKDPMAGDEELTNMLNDVYGKVREAVNSGDRDSLVNMLSARTGKSKEEINKSVDKIEKVYQDVKKEYNEAVATAERKYNEAVATAERKAREAAAETASAIAKVTVWTFVALVGGMVVTTIGATMGVSRPTLFYFW